MKLTVAIALVASASAFAPAQFARMPTTLNFEYGEYDDKMWDNDAKKDVYSKWDPASPRTSKNFNPFETFKGNSCEASGVFPGEVSNFSLVGSASGSTVPFEVCFVNKYSRFITFPFTSPDTRTLRVAMSVLPS